MRTATSPERPVVLVVEDHPDTQELYHLVLANAGYDVHVAHDGEEALARLETIRPALVVLDIGLPKVDGIAVCRRMRSHARFAALPVLAVSAWLGGGPAADKVAAADFTELLAKPIQPDLLLEAVQRWAPYRRPARPATEVAAGVTR